MNSTRPRRGWDEPPKEAAAPSGSAQGSSGGLDLTGAEGVKTGRVKAWFDDQGFGFIMQDDGAEDLFVHRSALTDGNLLVVGTAVCFEVVWNDRQQKHMAAKLTGASNPVTAGISSTASAFGAITDLPPGKKGGRVKAWFEDQGFGFVMQDDGSEDLFVHRSALTDGNLLLVGAPVAYEVVWNQQKGKNLAANLSGASSPEKAGIATSQVPTPAAQDYYGGGGAFAGAAAAVGKKCGRVKAWIEEKGFGFILQDDGGEDLFVHRSGLRDGGSLIVGTTVTYVSEWNERKQKFLAQEVTGAVPQDRGGYADAMAPPHGGGALMIANDYGHGGYGRAVPQPVGPVSRYDPYGGGAGVPAQGGDPYGAVGALKALGELAEAELSKAGNMSFKEFEALYDAQQAAKEAAGAISGQYDRYGEQSFTAADSAAAADQYDPYGEQSFWPGA